MSINHVTISGNLTRDAELRSTGSGMSVLQFGVAVNERVKNNQTGEYEDRPNFVDCAMFGKRADAIAQYLAKGTKVAIEGKLRYSKWQDKDGGNRSKLEVIVDELEFMSSNQQNASQPPMQRQAYSQPQYQQPAPQMAPQQAYAPQYQQPMQQMPMQMQMPQGMAQANQMAAQVYQAQQQMAPSASTSIYDEDIPFD